MKISGGPFIVREIHQRAFPLSARSASGHHPSQLSRMPPKKKSRVEQVDGVHCSFNFASGLVIVGSGLASHDKRDSFKLKAGSTLEAQVRVRPRFKELAAAICLLNIDMCWVGDSL